MELFDQLCKNPWIHYTFCITFKSYLELEISCSVLRADEEILRFHNLRFITLDLLMSYNSLIIIKEITTVKEVSYVLDGCTLPTGKYRRLQGV